MRSYKQWLLREAKLVFSKDDLCNCLSNIKASILNTHHTHIHTLMYATLNEPSRPYLYICFYMQCNSNCIYKQHIHIGITLKESYRLCSYIYFYIQCNSNNERPRGHVFERECEVKVEVWRWIESREVVIRNKREQNWT